MNFDALSFVLGMVFAWLVLPQLLGLLRGLGRAR